MKENKQMMKNKVTEKARQIIGQKKDFSDESEF